jgi:protein CpxP
MTRKRLVTGSIAALVLALVATVSVAAGGRQGHGPRGFGGGMGFGPGLPPLRMLAVALDLTEAQQEQARAILDAHKTELQQLGERSRTAREQVRAAVEAPALNEAAIRAAVDAASKVQADGAVLHAKIRQEVFNVLTPEQRAKAEQLKNTARDGMRRRMQRQGGQTPPADK